MIQYSSFFRNALIIFSFFLNVNLHAQKDSLSILHITDLHTIFKQQLYNKAMIENRTQKQYNQSVTRLRNFLSTIPKQTKSDMIIATGDLVDFFEANDKNNKTIDIQIGQFAKLLNAYHTTPVYLTIGNHDGFSFEWCKDKLLHNQHNTGSANALWIKNLDCFDKGTYYSNIYQVGKRTFRLIFLNDSFYEFDPDDSTQVPYIDKPQLYWLKDQLNASKDDVEIVLMHIPFKQTENQPIEANPLFKLLTAYSSCKLILAGHYHKNNITEYPAAGNNRLVQVQTGALSQTGDWRLIKLFENEITVSVPDSVVNELVIPLN